MKKIVGYIDRVKGGYVKVKEKDEEKDEQEQE